MRQRRHRHFRIKRGRLPQLILFAVMAVSAVMLTITLIRYLCDRASYASARSLAVSTPAPTAEAAPLAAISPAPDTTPTPEPMETPPITVDFAAVREEGRHVRGWLYSPGTIIHYPVVYYTNNTYYLTHDYTGRRANAGALFFDARVGKELSGDNLIIYGHHMKDGSMFRNLLEYQKQAYYDAHPTMYLLTLTGNYRVDLFAGRFTDSSAEQYPVWFETAQARETYVRTALAESDFTPVDTQCRSDARMLSLVTCAYSNYIEDAKYQVLGWLTPIGQSAEPSA